jgi:hypothetical protein
VGPAVAAKEHALAPQGEHQAGDHVSCHISILRLSPSLLLTPRAADGS